MEPVWAFFVDFFAFRLRSRRIWDPGRAEDSARHAGHRGANSSGIGRLLSRSATHSRSSRPALRKAETIRNEKRSDTFNSFLIVFIVFGSFSIGVNRFGFDFRSFLIVVNYAFNSFQAHLITKKQDTRARNSTPTRTTESGSPTSTARCPPSALPRRSCPVLRL